jgi:ATP-dependent RNA helicase DeaD
VDIRDDYSLVDLPDGMPDDVLQHLKKVWVVGQQLRIVPDGQPFDPPRKPGKLALRDGQEPDRGARPADKALRKFPGKPAGKPRTKPPGKPKYRT